MKNINYLLNCIWLLLLASCSMPVASFLVKGESHEAPAQLTLENNSKNAVTYQWDFGDGTTSIEQSPSHKFLHSGNYEISLIVKNQKGKENQTKSRIMVKPPEKCMVELQTIHGNMVIELYDDTPKHRDNFSKLVEEGFYTDLLFHRVMSGFMIQGGDPQSKDARPGQHLGTGGPGYQIPAEIITDYVHVKGALAAARQPDNVNPEFKSSGSQFYIVQGKTLTEQELNLMEQRMGIEYTAEQRETYLSRGGAPFLDTQYTVFGEVISGMDVIDKIASIKVGPGNRPVEDLNMKFILIK